jgi:uncharacterized protein YjbI with pentapeptide repeats
VDEVQQVTGDESAPDGFATWAAYWTTQGMPWRTEPEIAEARQRYLAERRAVTPDIARGVYPFRDEHGGIPLDRADVEWLLATHESGGLRGPVAWSDASQWLREGLDLRGADLRGVDLRSDYPAGLPLTRLRAGLTTTEWRAATPEQREAAAVHLEGATLVEAHLELARLRDARCADADLRRVQLQGARAQGIRLHGADLRRAVLEGTDLSEARLDGGQLAPDYVASLRRIQPAFPASLPAADLRSAFFDAHSTLRQATLGDARHGWVSVADVRWNGVNLATQAWEQVAQVGDERAARSSRDAHGQHGEHGERKGRQARQSAFADAARANRQLAAACRAQGLRPLEARFAYRAEVLERRAARYRGRWLRWVGGLLLDATSGYGYRPLRSFLTYLLVVGTFAITYSLLGHEVGPPVDPLGAVVFSITSFHGRGFAPGGNVTLDHPMAVLAAIEGIIGLLIEITFIATFTQRFFAR